MEATLSLENKVAVVTGASRGIGRAIALELAKRGAAVVVNYNHAADKAQEVVAAIRETGGQAEAFQANVAEFAQAKALIDFAVKTFGGIHILVNNAGITRDNLIMLMKEDDWDAVIATNLKGTFNCSKAAVRPMMRKRWGRIINISSVAGTIGNPGQTNYSASKAGQIGFTKALAREVASRNITVNAICPGYIGTEMVRAIPEKVLAERIVPQIPVGRLGEPEEIARCVLFLVSDEAGFITGSTMTANGGQYFA